MQELLEKIRERMGEEYQVTEVDKQTGLKPYAVRKMFRHPLYPFMLANVDFFVEINGEIYIIECKTSFSFHMEEWEDNGIPRHYELQGRHYMAVTNVKGVLVLGNVRYQAGYTKRVTTSINKEGMEAMGILYPDICREYAKTNVSRSFYIKREKAEMGERSLIRLNMLDYSSGTGEKTVSVYANISPEEARYIYSALSCHLLEIVHLVKRGGVGDFSYLHCLFSIGKKLRS